MSDDPVNPSHYHGDLVARIIERFDLNTSKPSLEGVRAVHNLKRLYNMYKLRVKGRLFWPNEWPGLKRW